MSIQPSSSRLLIWLAYVFLTLVWGTGWYAIRVCVGEGGYSVVGGAAWRYTLAVGVLVVAVPLFRGAFGSLRVDRLGWLVLASACNALAMALLYWGETSVSGGLAAVLVATSPFMAAALVLLTRSEAVSQRTISGFIIALAGIGIIFAERITVFPSHLGAMAGILGASLCFAIVNFIIKTRASDVSC